ncbi:dnaJ homolog subfamily C member 30, mitochondrial-like [Argiope bruennichi]|uniref:dnaJ homolog subfamily C member 30, mitochondrial-like n=1 Tax=Argiope bruennichi TaxID=94029 RepID=UPI002494BE86|nr:dnaJ homolog subfamily C member 30, mitochondrial-like [Argiope bruennichi]
MNRILNKSKFCCPSNSSINNTVKLEIFSVHFTRYKSYYTALGLDSNASQKDIKSAYYKLSLKYHPDKTDGCPEATEKFREITEAYEVLGNPEKKSAYDENIRIRGPFQYDFKKDNFGRRPDQYYRTPPRTGRTRYYNYDEHFKQHYEEYMKQREAENEYFRRRWEADRRARYGDEYRWQNYYRTSQRPPITLTSLLQNRSFIYLLTFWILIFLSGALIEDRDKVERKIIYYNVKDNKKTDDSEDK